MKAATNRLYSITHPQAHDSIAWYHDKETYIRHFRQCMVLPNLTEDSILQELQLPKTDDNLSYAGYLLNGINQVRDNRRAMAIETNKERSDNKVKEIAKILLREPKIKNKDLAARTSISVGHLPRLKKLALERNANSELMDNISVLKSRLNEYFKTKRDIKNWGYDNIDKRRLGNIRHIESLLNRYNVSGEKFVSIIGGNTSFILEMINLYQSGSLNSILKCVHMFDAKANIWGYTKEVKATLTIDEKRDIIKRAKAINREILDTKENISLAKLILDYDV